MYVLVDIGGTKTRVATSDDLESFGEPTIFDTIHQYEEGFSTLIETVRACTRGKPIEKMVVGMPGTQARDHRSSFVSGVGTLNGWSNRPFADDIEKALNTSVRLENDAALVGLGEAAFGAGRGARIVAYVTVSTGIGGVRVVDGQLDNVIHGAEVGGQYLSYADAVTLEALVSGTAVQQKYGVHPRELGADSPVWEELARVFAFGLYNSLLHWSPERVVLGGSMFNEIGIKVERVAAHLAEINVKMSEIPEIVHSELKDLGGLWGGLARLKQLR